MTFEKLIIDPLSLKSSVESSRIPCFSLRYSASRLARASFSSAARFSSNCLFSSRIAREISFCRRLDAFDLAETDFLFVAAARQAVHDHGISSTAWVTCTQVKWYHKSQPSHCTISIVSISVHNTQLATEPGFCINPNLVRDLFIVIY